MIIEKRMSEDVWNKFYKATFFSSIRYPDGMNFEDKATTFKLLLEANKLTYILTPLIHYRNRTNSISNSHSIKNLIDYWIVYRQRFELLKNLSKQYYIISLSECVGAISRMWCWIDGCPREDRWNSCKF